MTIELRCLSRAFSFVLFTGVEIFPVQMKRRGSDALAFRISPGGKGGNTNSMSEDADEATMIYKVLTLGYAVRCTSVDGHTYGLYKANKRSVREVRLKPV
jgi:hypothetical protein